MTEPLMEIYLFKITLLYTLMGKLTHQVLHITAPYPPNPQIILYPLQRNLQVSQVCKVEKLY